jgi:hypothetical protein
MYVFDLFPDILFFKLALLIQVWCSFKKNLGKNL